MHPCPFCDETFPSDFIFIKLRHKTLIKSLCYCRHAGCSRSFNNIYAFRRRYNSKHVAVSAGVERGKNKTGVENISDCDRPETSNININTAVTETSRSMIKPGPSAGGLTTSTIHDHTAVTDTETSRSTIEPCPSVCDFVAVVDEAVTSFTSK